MKINEVYTKQSGYLLTETKTYQLWESAGRKLVEANLTNAQIMAVFKAAEAGATAAGGNRTMVGRSKDAASAVNQAWEDLKTKVQNSGPIKNVDGMYDQAAEKLKQATGGDQGVMQYVQKYRDFAKKHPVSQSLIYAALIAAAGISGAGLGGAAALGLFKMTDKLLQGEKFSSATYQGAKTGGMAYAAGQLGQAIKGQPAATSDTLAQSMPRAGYSTASDTASNTMSGVTGNQITSNPAYQAVIQKFGDTPGARKAAMAAAKAAIAKGQMNESVQLSESQIYLIIGSIVSQQNKLDEGIMDTVKSAAGKVGGAIKGAAGKAATWAKTKGANLTTKVTADKLLQAWKKAGSPTDSAKISEILTTAGVKPAVIAGAYKAAGIRGASSVKPAAASAGAFGNMAGQLAPTVSATGGTTTATPGRTTHVANPNNPNATRAAQPTPTATSPTATNTAKPTATSPTATNTAKPTATSPTATNTAPVTGTTAPTANNPIQPPVRLTAKQIVAALPSMNRKQLTSIQNSLTRVLASKTSKPIATNRAPQPVTNTPSPAAPAGRTPNLRVAP